MIKIISTIINLFSKLEYLWMNDVYLEKKEYDKRHILDRRI